MANIIRLAVFAVILIVAYKEGLPWLQEHLDFGSGPVADEGPMRCVHLADQASDVFGENVGRASGPGGDGGVWEDFKGSVEVRIETALDGCRCSATACQKASEAMDELSHLLDQLDVRFRDGTPTTRNFVDLQFHVNELLNQARSLAQQGR